MYTLLSDVESIDSGEYLQVHCTVAVTYMRGGSNAQFPKQNNFGHLTRKACVEIHNSVATPMLVYTNHCNQDT